MNNAKRLMMVAQLASLMPLLDTPRHSQSSGIRVGVPDDPYTLRFDGFSDFDDFARDVVRRYGSTAANNLTAQPVKPLKPHAFQKKQSKRDRKRGAK